jgi:hypothetical protein
MHRTRLALSQVKALPWAPPGGGIPSISTVNAQAKCRCAQVIHIFVHSQHMRSSLAVLAGSSRSARQCGAYVTRPAERTRASRPGADEIMRNAGCDARRGLGRGGGHDSLRAYRLRSLPGRVGNSPALPGVTGVIAGGIPAIAGVPVLEENVPADQN